MTVPRKRGAILAALWAGLRPVSHSVIKRRALVLRSEPPEIQQRKHVQRYLVKFLFISSLARCSLAWRAL